MYQGSWTSVQVRIQITGMNCVQLSGVRPLLHPFIDVLDSSPLGRRDADGCLALPGRYFQVLFQVLLACQVSYQEEDRRATVPASP